MMNLTCKIFGARSKTVTSIPSRRQAMAQTKPPIPAPTITTFIVKIMGQMFKVSFGLYTKNEY